MTHLEAHHVGGGLHLAAALALVILVAFGCSRGDGGDSSPDQGNSAQTPAATQTAPSGEIRSPTLPPNGDTLQGLAARFVQGVDGRVSYRYVSNFAQHPDGVFTVFKLSDNYYRQDWTTEGVTTTVIVAGDDVYVCTQIPSITSCLRETEENARSLIYLFSPITDVPEAIAGGFPGLESTELPDEIIAGVEAKCFQLTAPGLLGLGSTGTEEVKICFSQNGQLLLTERTVLFENKTLPTGDFRLEAQEVSDVSTADFEPLGPVQ